jgi:hypothetical protein
MQTNTGKLFLFDIQTLEILTILHLKKAAPRPEVLFFNRKKLHERNGQADLRNMFPRSVCTLTLWYVLTPCLLLYQFL